MKTNIKLLKECATKRADKDSNGYFIVMENWNTCFFRWWDTERDEIQVRANSDPRCFHTYTRIPKKYTDKVFFVYANTDSGVVLTLEKNDLVVGTYQPQKSGRFYNYAFIIYCQDETPLIRGASVNGVFIERKDEDELIPFEPHDLLPKGLFVRSYVPRCVTQTKKNTFPLAL